MSFSDQDADQTYPESTACPQFNSFSQERLQHLMNPVAAIRAATHEDYGINTDSDPYPNVFQFTHRPISVYKTDTIGTRDADSLDSVSEEEVYQNFTKEHSRNFAAVIQGPVGTGKSELCAYLTHRLRDQGRPVLEVRKDDGLMTLLSERIPNFYVKHLDEEYPHQADFEQIQSDLNDDGMEGVLAEALVNNGIIQLRQDGYEIHLSDEKRAKFVELIRDNLDVLREAAEDEDRGSQIVTQQLYDHHEYLHIFKDNIEEPSGVLNRYLWQALLNRYSTRGLKDVFESVAKKFDKRPVAVFEDFSIASVQAEELGKFIERDNHGDTWDFVIAGTTDSLRPLRSRTFRSRFPIYQTNKSDTNQVAFLTEDNVIEFIEPYLAYVKGSDDSIHSVESPQEADYPLEKKPPEPGSLCGVCDICPDDEHYLFPFNEVFIRRIYSPGLPESERSPRKLIEVIRQVLDETYYGPIQVPSNASPLESLTTNVTLHDAVYEEAPEFVDFAKWYGVHQSDYIEVDRRFADVFGLLSSEDNDADKAGGIEYGEEVVRIPLQQANLEGAHAAQDDSNDATPSETEDGRAQSVEEDADEVADISEDEKKEEDRDMADLVFDNHKRSVDNWRSNPTDERHRDANKYISIAFERLINHLTTDYSVWTGSDLRYNLSRSKRPFVYANTDNSPDADQIVLAPEEFRLTTLRRILRYGIEMDFGEPDTDGILRESGTQFTRLADRWQRTIQRNFIGDEDILFSKKATNVDFDDFVIAGYTLCVLLDDPWNHVTASRLNERFGDSTPFELGDVLEAGLTGPPSERKDHLNQLVTFGPKFESLLETRMSVSSNRLDLPTVQARMQKFTATELLDKLAKTRVDEVTTRLRFTGKEDQLKKLGEVARKSNNHLKEIEQHTHVSELAHTVDTRLSNVTMDELKPLIDNMVRSYDDVMEPQFKEQLDRLNDFTQDDINEVRQGASVANPDKAVGSSKFDRQTRIQQTMAAIKLQNHPFIKNINSLFDVNPRQSEEFAPSFQEVSAFYVE